MNLTDFHLFPGWQFLCRTDSPTVIIIDKPGKDHRHTQTSNNSLGKTILNNKPKIIFDLACLFSAFYCNIVYV